MVSIYVWTWIRAPVTWGILFTIVFAKTVLGGHQNNWDCISSYTACCGHPILALAPLLRNSSDSFPSRSTFRDVRKSKVESRKVESRKSKVEKSKSRKLKVESRKSKSRKAEKVEKSKIKSRKSKVEKLKVEKSKVEKSKVESWKSKNWALPEKPPRTRLEQPP